jgi:excisionase family DNA binding protein
MENYLTVKEVCDLTELSKQRISQLIQSGSLPAKRIKGKYQILREHAEMIRDGKTIPVESSGEQTEQYTVTIEATITIRRKGKRR